MNDFEKRWCLISEFMCKDLTCGTPIVDGAGKVYYQMRRMFFKDTFGRTAIFRCSVCGREHREDIPSALS